MDRFREMPEPTEDRASAGTALFRLAQLRDDQGRLGEAFNAYQGFLLDFPNREAEAAICRRWLDSNLSDFSQSATTCRMIEDGIELSKNSYRSTWRVTAVMKPDQLFLTVSAVEPDAEAGDGLPAGFEVRTLHYAPSGRIERDFSRTFSISPDIQSEDDAWNQINHFNIFGQSYDVPEGLAFVSTGSFPVNRLLWKSSGPEVAHSYRYFSFSNNRDNPTRKLMLGLSFGPVGLEDAIDECEARNLSLPVLGKEAWSFHLSPAPGEPKD